jgi:hypothetical protein
MSNSKDLILSLLDEVNITKMIYKNKMTKMKKYDDIAEAILIGAGAIAMSSLFITLGSINPVTLIVGSVFTSVSPVGQAVKKVIDIKGKYESFKTTHNQYSDLEREVRAILVRNHLDSNDLKALLDDINHRLSLIEDSSLPVRTRK